MGTAALADRLSPPRERRARSAEERAGPPDARAAFRSLYDRTAVPLRAYLSRMAGADLADDLLQDTYLRFLSADPPEMTEEQTVSYLYTTATRLVYDRWRRERTARSWEDTAMIEDREDPEPLDLRRDLTSALEGLAPRERALLWLAYGEGRAHREIAGILDVGELSVRVLLFRARKKLAKILKERGLGPEAFA